MFKNAKTECEGLEKGIDSVCVGAQSGTITTAFSKQQGWCENARSRRDSEHEVLLGRSPLCSPQGNSLHLFESEWMKDRIRTGILAILTSHID